MHLSTLWAVLGFGSLIAAGVVISRVESAELGTWSSRFVAVVLAILAYYGVSSVAEDYPALVLHPVKYEFMKYAIPAVGGISLIFLGFKVYENRKEEIKSVMESGRKLAAIVVLALLGRFFLSL